MTIHWTGNPGQTAKGLKKYFDKDTLVVKRYGSSNYIIGLQGEILQIIPDDEVSWHVYGPDVKDDMFLKYGFPNDTMISVELCTIDSDGRFNLATINSLITLCSAKINQYGFLSSDILRHFDFSKKGKDCPRWYVNHTDDWEKLINAVDLVARIMRGGHLV